MEKNRPAWQKGKLNGIGGRIEEGETSVACMMREAKEEANITSKKGDWHHFAVMEGPSWSVEFFSLVFSGKESDIKTTTDEKVSWYNARALPDNALMNVFWLVPLAIDKLQGDEFDSVKVHYKRDY